MQGAQMESFYDAITIQETTMCEQPRQQILPPLQVPAEAVDGPC